MSKSQIATGGIADDAVSTAKIFNDNRIVTPLIINGDMAVAQRGTQTTGIGASDGYFTVDRFQYAKEGSPSARFTISQSTVVPSGQGFSTSLKMDCTTAQSSLSAGDGFNIQQKIEAQNLQLLRYGTSSAKKITLSFWVRAAKAGTNVVWIYQNDDARSQAQSYTISSTDTWEKKIINFVADTTGVIDNNNGEGFRISWWLGAGTNFTSGSLATTWQSHSSAITAVGQVNNADTSGNDFYLTGVQLEVGEFDSDTIPPFPFESVGNNLEKCKRYYQKLGNTTDDYSFGRVAGNNNTYGIFGMVLPVTMRADPTATLQVDPENGGFSSVSMGHTGPNFVATDATNSGWADIGTIEADAEL